MLDLAMIKSEHEELQTVYFALRSAWSTCRELMARQPELAEPVICLLYTSDAADE